VLIVIFQGSHPRESDYNIGAEDHPENFAQFMSCKKLNLWYDIMIDEMNSIENSSAWDLVELPNRVTVIGC
jgi:hypothetical protein